MLDAKTGVCVWEYRVGGREHGVVSTPAYADGVVYAQVHDALYAFDADPRDGKDEGIADEFGAHGTGYDVLWTTPIKGRVYTSSPKVHGDHVYLADDAGVHVIERASGKEVALLPTSGGIWSTVAIHQDRLFVGGAKGLHCFDLATRKEAWMVATEARVASSPAVDTDGRVFFGCDDGKVRAVSASDGRELWSATTGTKFNHTPALADGLVMVGSFDRAGVVALDPATGAELWFYAVPDVPPVTPGKESKRTPRASVRGTMVATKDRLVFTSMNGFLYVIRTDRAAVAERLVYRFEGGNGAPAVVGGSIYVRARPEGMKRPAEVFRLDPR